MPVKTYDMEMAKELLTQLESNHWIQQYGMKNMYQSIATMLQKPDVNRQWLAHNDHEMDIRFAKYVTKWANLNDIDVELNLIIKTELTIDSEISTYVWDALNKKSKSERQHILHEIAHDMQLIKDHVYLNDDFQSNDFNQFQRWEIQSYAVKVRNMEHTIASLYEENLIDYY